MPTQAEAIGVPRPRVWISSFRAGSDCSEARKSSTSAGLRALRAGTISRSAASACSIGSAVTRCPVAVRTWGSKPTVRTYQDGADCAPRAEHGGRLASGDSENQEL